MFGAGADFFSAAGTLAGAVVFASVEMGATTVARVVSAVPISGDSVLSGDGGGEAREGLVSDGAASAQAFDPRASLRPDAAGMISRVKRSGKKKPVAGLAVAVGAGDGTPEVI